MNKIITMVLTIIISLSFAFHSEVKAQEVTLDLNEGFETITIDSFRISYDKSLGRVVISTLSKREFVEVILEGVKGRTTLDNNFLTVFTGEIIVMDEAKNVSSIEVLPTNMVSLGMVLHKDSSFFLALDRRTEKGRKVKILFVKLFNMYSIRISSGSPGFSRQIPINYLLYR